MSCSILPALRVVFVGFVGLLLFSVPFLGFTFLLPNLYSGVPLVLHLSWSVLLAANTYFNFAAAVLRPPGSVAISSKPHFQCYPNCLSSMKVCRLMISFIQRI